MVSRTFLKPRSVDRPPQGDFEYIPVVKLLESTSVADLQAMLEVELGVQAQSTDEFWVVEDIQFQFADKPGHNDRYIIMLWATKVKKV